VRILLLLGALAAGAVVAGCGHGTTSAPAPTTTPAAPASGASSGGGSPAGPTALPVQDVAAGSDGLTVRYADRDGSVKTLRVEDFRR
jgi:hypothetical protein